MQTPCGAQNHNAIRTRSGQYTMIAGQTLSPATTKPFPENHVAPASASLNLPIRWKLTSHVLKLILCALKPSPQDQNITHAMTSEKLFDWHCLHNKAVSEQGRFTRQKLFKTCAKPTKHIRYTCARECIRLYNQTHWRFEIISIVQCVQIRL